MIKRFPPKRFPSGRIPDKPSGMTNVDLMIQNGQILTMNSSRDIKVSESIVIHAGKIIDIGFTDLIKATYTAQTVIDAKDHIILPGLINTHTHAPLVYMRGVIDDVNLETWLHKYIFPLEGKFVTPDFVKASTRLALSEMLLSGTTTFNDSYFFTREIASVAKDFGMRCILGEGVLGFPSPSHKSTDETLAYTEENLQQWKTEELITASIAPHSLYTCSAEVIHRSFSLAQKYSALVHLHLAESKAEVHEIKTKYGRTPVGILKEWGLLGPKLVAAHCAQLTDEDIDLLVEHQVGIAHNPESNLKLGNGVAPISKLIRKGGKVGLGTDSAASNNNLDLLSEVDFAAKLQKGIYPETGPLNSIEAVEMLTINGAKVLGLDHKIGSIEIGKQADLILIDTQKPHLTPLYNPYSHLVYSAMGSDVSDVIINGKVVVRNCQITGCDLEGIFSEAHEYQQKIKAFLDDK